MGDREQSVQNDIFRAFHARDSDLVVNAIQVVRTPLVMYREIEMFGLIMVQALVSATSALSKTTSVRRELTRVNLNRAQSSDGTS